MIEGDDPGRVNREHLARNVDSAEIKKLLVRLAETKTPDKWLADPISPRECPRQPHRAPQGPNEDVGQCPLCWSLSYEMRPENETYGLHADDCSLPIRHKSYCVGGGTGHPRAPVIRGYWKELEP